MVRTRSGTPPWTDLASAWVSMLASITQAAPPNPADCFDWNMEQASPGCYVVPPPPHDCNNPLSPFFNCAGPLIVYPLQINYQVVLARMQVWGLKANPPVGPGNYTVSITTTNPAAYMEDAGNTIMVGPGVCLPSGDCSCNAWNPGTHWVVTTPTLSFNINAYKIVGAAKVLMGSGAAGTTFNFVATAAEANAGFLIERATALPVPLPLQPCNNSQPGFNCLCGYEHSYHKWTLSTATITPV